MPLRVEKKALWKEIKTHEEAIKGLKREGQRLNEQMKESDEETTIIMGKITGLETVMKAMTGVEGTVSNEGDVGDVGDVEVVEVVEVDDSDGVATEVIDDCSKGTGASTKATVEASTSTNGTVVTSTATADASKATKASTKGRAVAAPSSVGTSRPSSDDAARHYRYSVDGSRASKGTARTDGASDGASGDVASSTSTSSATSRTPSSDASSSSAATSLPPPSRSTSDYAAEILSQILPQQSLPNFKRRATSVSEEPDKKRKKQKTEVAVEDTVEPELLVGPFKKFGRRKHSEEDSDEDYHEDYVVKSRPTLRRRTRSSVANGVAEGEAVGSSDDEGEEEEGNSEVGHSSIDELFTEKVEGASGGTSEGTSTSIEKEKEKEVKTEMKSKVKIEPYSFLDVDAKLPQAPRSSWDLYSSHNTQLALLGTSESTSTQLPGPKELLNTRSDPKVLKPLSQYCLMKYPQYWAQFHSLDQMGPRNEEGNVLCQWARGQQQCGGRMKEMVRFRNHVYKSHAVKTYVCVLCPQQCAYWSELVEHCQSAHSGRMGKEWVGYFDEA